LSHGDVGAMGAIKFTFYRHDRDIFMTSKKNQLIYWIMLIVSEPAYVIVCRGGAGAINMLIVPESAFPYYLLRIFVFRGKPTISHLSCVDSNTKIWG